MNYQDGQLVHLGDKVNLWEGCEGTVVCSLDTNEFSDSFPASEWTYLREGVVIESAQAGLIHYLKPEPTFHLISRRDSNQQGMSD